MEMRKGGGKRGSWFCRKSVIDIKMKLYTKMMKVISETEEINCKWSQHWSLRDTRDTLYPPDWFFSRCAFFCCPCDCTRTCATWRDIFLRSWHIHMCCHICCVSHSVSVWRRQQEAHCKQGLQLSSSCTSWYRSCCWVDPFHGPCPGVLVYSLSSVASSTVLRLCQETHQIFLQHICHPGRAGLSVHHDWAAGTISRYPSWWGHSQKAKLKKHRSSGDKERNDLWPPPTKKNFT